MHNIMHQTNIKKLFILSIVSLMALAMVSVASAEFWACFSEGQQIDFCNNNVQDRTCGSTLCKFCMSEFVEAQGCYNQGNLNICNGLSGTQQNCGNQGGNTSIDSEPPELTILSPSPLNDSIFTTTNVPLTYEVNEKADIYYLNDGNRWTRICAGCTGLIQQTQKFQEGAINLTLRAQDVVGNQAFTSVSFFVDSRDPRITKTEPRKGFSSGIFHAQFIEQFPINLMLFFGTNSNLKSQEIDVNKSCTYQGKQKYFCDFFADVTMFDGQTMMYWLNLTDIAGNSDASRVEQLSVDITPPDLKDFNYTIDGRRVEFMLLINETNFDEVNYIDLLDPRPRERRLCSRLDDEGYCTKRVSFKDGEHLLNFTILDEAGNKHAFNVSFFTDSKDPRLGRSNPSRGFADGWFDVQFQEQNPVSLFLNYGNAGTGISSTELDLVSNCSVNRGKTTCATFVDIMPYDGQEISYWFNITDRVGQTDSSRPKSLGVDTTFPVINVFNHTVNGRSVTFFLHINELNLDEINYRDNAGTSTRWRRLCSRVDTAGVCEREVSFSPGFHDVDIQVVDEAGNSVAENVQFDIV